MTTSVSPEHWEFAGRSLDRETGLEVCDVRHLKLAPTTRVCTYRLIKLDGRWRHWATLVGDLPLAGWRRVPERKGKLLSNSRQDLTLLSFAETGHGSVYA